MTKLISIYDSKAELYSYPMIIRSSGEALRLIAADSLNPETKLARHPADFTVFEIGEFDEHTGRVTQHPANINIGAVVELQAAALRESRRQADLFNPKAEAQQ